MFVVNDDKSIYLTRGDIAVLEISARNASGGDHMFKVGDIVCFKVFEKKNHKNIVLRKESYVTTESQYVSVSLAKDDTKIGEMIDKPEDYWYEIELNPDTEPQTIVGYDADGPKVLRLFPEGADSE